MANLTKDQRIIKDNPEASPYELKALGLSDKAFEEMMGGSKEQQEQPAKVAPQIQVNTKAQPKVSSYTAPSSKGMAYLINKKRGGQTKMTLASAQRQARKYPNEYDVKEI